MKENEGRTRSVGVLPSASPTSPQSSAVGPGSAALRGEDGMLCSKRGRGCCCLRCHALLVRLMVVLRKPWHTPLELL